MKERIGWIDFAKGIAIVCVVLGHVVSSYHNSNLFMHNHIFNFTHQFVYSFHMALFMIISGYLVSSGRKKGSRRQQVVQKLINYGIPYVVFSVLWVLMKMMMASHTNTPLTFYDLLLIPVYPISFMWFIYALLLMQIIQSFVVTKSWMIKILHLLAAGAVYFLQPCLARKLARINFMDCVLNDFFNNYIFFLVGAYLAEYIVAWLTTHSIAAMIASGLVLILGNVICYELVLSVSKSVSLILAITGSVFVMAFCMRIKHNRLFEYLGRQSLPIYVLHATAISAMRLLLTKLNLNICYGIIPLVFCTYVGCLFPIVAYQISTTIWKLDGCFYPGRYIKG